MPKESSQQPEVEIERCEWVAATSGQVSLRLAGSVSSPRAVPPATGSRLIAETDSAADGKAGDPRALRPIQGAYWRDGRWSCSFSVSLELAQQPRTQFLLELTGLAVIPLPAPPRPAAGRIELSPEPAVSPAAGLTPPAEQPAGGTVLGGPARRTARVALGVLVGATLGLLAWGAVWVLGGNRPGGRLNSDSAVQRAASAAPASMGSSAVIAVPPGGSLVAEARVRRVSVYPSPGARVPNIALSNPNSDGEPLVFLVAAAGPGRLRVLLPTRPNLSAGWVSRSQVRLALDPYRIDVQLRRHLMTVWRDARLMERDPVGVGRRAVTPTPFGLYYITELLKQPNPSGIYGPYAFGLSAHSNVLHEFAGGDGEIGIHGTNEPWAVGTDVSHGCIRVYNRVITRLASKLPLGTPVWIRP